MIALKKCKSLESLQMSPPHVVTFAEPLSSASVEANASPPSVPSAVGNNGGNHSVTIYAGATLPRRDKQHASSRKENFRAAVNRSFDTSTPDIMETCKIAIIFFFLKLQFTSREMYSVDLFTLIFFNEVDKLIFDGLVLNL